MTAISHLIPNLVGDSDDVISDEALYGVVQHYADSFQPWAKTFVHPARRSTMGSIVDTYAPAVKSDLSGITMVFETRNVVQEEGYTLTGRFAEEYHVKEAKFNEKYELDNSMYAKPKNVTTWALELTPDIWQELTGSCNLHEYYDLAPYAVLRTPWESFMLVQPMDFLIQAGEHDVYRCARASFIETYGREEEVAGTAAATGRSIFEQARSDPHEIDTMERARGH